MTNRSTAAVRSAAAKRTKTTKVANTPAPEAAPVEPEVVAAPAAEVVAAPAATVEAPAVEPDLKSEKSGKKKKKDKKEKKAKKAKKEAVLIRFEDAQLAAIDSQAEALGLSRAAWVRMVVAKALGAA